MTNTLIAVCIGVGFFLLACGVAAAMLWRASMEEGADLG